MCFLKKHKEFSWFARVSCQLRMDICREERKKNAKYLLDSLRPRAVSLLLNNPRDKAKKNATHIRAVSRKSASVICEATAHK